MISFAYPYPGSKPKTISFCAFIGQMIVASLVWTVIYCVGILISCILIAAIPIALIFGRRPCFIEFLKDPAGHRVLFQEYELPEVFGWKMWPILYLTLMAYGYLLTKYISPEAYFMGARHFLLGYLLVLMGAIGLVLVVMENIPSRKILEKLPNIRKTFAWWLTLKAKVCPTIEIVD